MGRPRFEVADVVRAHADDYRLRELPHRGHFVTSTTKTRGSEEAERLD